MMRTCILVNLLVAFFLDAGMAAGSGRAFPIDSENYVTEQFQAINRNLAWDPTNFLVDLAGHYANCAQIGNRGEVTVSQQTPEGANIVGIVDYTDGTHSDVDSVNGYIRTVINNWIDTRFVHKQISNANRFGCSVRPGCTGKVSIACLFSLKVSNIEETEEPEIPNPPGGQNALAFTTEQYNLAEQITGKSWDRSHFLENLSGFETDCAMIGNNDWPFNQASTIADDAGISIIGEYGYAQNTGSTQSALVSILSKFKKIQNTKQVGCSLIPDCVVGQGRDTKMFVVVSCLHEEQYKK